MIDVEDRHWVRNVVVVTAALVVAMIGMSLVIPFLPLYLAELHVRPRDTSLWAGWVGGANFLFAAMFAPLWGTLADRYGRKPMACRALLGLAVTVGLMGWCQNPWHLLILRIFQGVFGGFVAESIALVGTSVPKDRMGSCLGMLQSGVVGGNLLGPLVGAELSHYFGFRQTFLITGGALLVALALVVLFVRESRSSGEQSPARGVAANVRELTALPVIRAMMVVVFCAHASLMLINPQITLLVRELVAPEQVKRMAGLVTSAPALTSFLMATVWGRLGDRRGHALVLAIALLACAVTAPWAAVAGSVWHLMIVRAAMGGFTSALNPSTHSVAAHAVDADRTAGAFSLLSSAQMLGACAGPFASGPLATAFGVRALFPITGLLLLTAGCAALRVRRLQRSGEAEQVNEASTP